MQFHFVFQIRNSDFWDFDYIVGMDNDNMRYMYLCMIIQLLF